MKSSWLRLRLTVHFVLSCCAIASMALLTQQASAQQVSADDTLTIPTNVSTISDKDFTITDGSRIGDNLFHSFEEFSVPAQGSAVFNNPADIANIISRVTGDQASSIDGLIKANGKNTNLFLLNRNGILFGPNAQLQIGGSFIASTAERLEFTNGANFMTDATALNPLLSISTPVGLQLGSTSGPIKVTDSGYTPLPGIIFPNIKLDSSSSLRVGQKQTLALIGSGIEFNGGVVATPGGHIELGSVREGLVTFDSHHQTFDYLNVQQFGDMEFSARSLVDASSSLFNATDEKPYASGTKGGSIQLRGDSLTFREASRALIQNYSQHDSQQDSAQASGNIQAIANDTLTLIGEFSTGERGSSLATMNFGPGDGGHVNIISPRLLLIGDTSIGTDTFTTGTGGNVTIKATETIRFESNQESIPDYGQINANSFGSSTGGNISIFTGNLAISGDGISSQSAGSGLGGSIKVEADQITLESGGNIAASSLFSGDGGDVTVTADTINIRGINPRSFLPSTITAPTVGVGDAGNVTVRARQIALLEGGRIDSSALAAGNSGVVNVTVLESLAVDGTLPGTDIPSLIISSANIASKEIKAFFKTIGVTLPPAPSGTSGNVIVKAPRLAVTNGAQVTVRNDGTGDAGTLTLNADSIYLSDRAAITASTQQGDGGNIVINTKNALLLRRGSRLSAEARRAGNGGNVVLNAPVIVALENSDITASAVQGAGGTITISARAILGTEFRDQLTPDSDITASSEFGISGEVDINSIESDPSSGAIALPESVVDPSDQVIAGCAGSSASQFVATGRGGLPLSPTSTVQANRPWLDTRAISLFAPEQLENREEASRPVAAPLQEAATWIVNEQGQVALVDLENSRLSNDLSNVACAKFSQHQ